MNEKHSTSTQTESTLGWLVGSLVPKEGKRRVFT